MGTVYDVTFRDAIIPTNRYRKLIGWTKKEAAREPERVAELALGAVACLQGNPVQDADGVHLDGCGFWGEAGHDFGSTIEEILLVCAPGSKMICRDTEGSDKRWCLVRLPGGKTREIESVSYLPGIDGPENLKGLANELHQRLIYRSGTRTAAFVLINEILAY